MWCDSRHYVWHHASNMKDIFVLFVRKETHHIPRNKMYGMVDVWCLPKTLYRYSLIMHPILPSVPLFHFQKLSGSFYISL